MWATYHDDEYPWAFEDPVRGEEAVALSAVRVVDALVELIGHQPTNDERNGDD